MSGSGVGSHSCVLSSHDAGVGVGIGIESQRCSIPISLATPIPRGFYAPFQGAGIILGPGPRVGLVPRPTRGYRLQRLRRWEGGGWRCGFLRRGSPRGVLVLVLGPMGVVEVVRRGWDSSTSTALRAEYEYEREGQWSQICPFDKSTARLGTQRIDWVGVRRLIPMTGSRQDGQDEQDGGGPRGCV